MLYLDQQAIDVIRHTTEAFLESFAGEPDAPCTPEAEQVLESLESTLMREINRWPDGRTLSAEDAILGLYDELEGFEFETSDLTYLVYSSDILQFFIDNEAEVDDAIWALGGLCELVGESDTISDMISHGVALAQSTRARSASAYYAEKSDVLREWLENELVEQYGHGWDEEEES